MKNTLTIIFSLLIHLTFSQTISIIAGDGFEEGDGTAIKEGFRNPLGVAVDDSGDVYIADCFTNRVLKIQSSTGKIKTIAGKYSNNADGNFTGDNGLAINSTLNHPFAVAVDPKGNVYIADYNNNRIRKIDGLTGIITTVAGTDKLGGGDGGLATDANLEDPTGVAVDQQGNLYIVERGKERIRKVDAKTGIITTFAGTGKAGTLGDGGPANKAQLYVPFGIAVDKKSNVYIVDGNNRVRKVNPSGVITTIVGSVNQGYSGDGKSASAAKLSLPSCIAVDSNGDLYISDTDNNCIRKVVSKTGIITTIAGKGKGVTMNSESKELVPVELDKPRGIAVDKNGNVFFTDKFYLRKIPK